MSRFTERLWNELIREHGAELAQMKRPATHGGHARPRVLAGTTLGLVAAAGAAIVLILGAAGSSPAFAVTRNHDGTVTVEIKRIDGITGANAKLASLGVRARAVAVVGGCERPPFHVPRAMLPARAKVRAGQLAAGVVMHTRFDPRQIPAGRTLVLPTVRVGDQIRIAKARSVRGLPPACLSLARPQLPGVAGRGRAVQCHASAVAVDALAARPPAAIKKILPPDVKKALARVRSAMRRIKAQGGARSVTIHDGSKLARVIKRNAPLQLQAKVARCREVAAPAVGHGGTAGSSAK